WNLFDLSERVLARGRFLSLATQARQSSTGGSTVHRNQCRLKLRHESAQTAGLSPGSNARQVVARDPDLTEQHPQESAQGAFRLVLLHRWPREPHSPLFIDGDRIEAPPLARAERDICSSEYEIPGGLTNERRVPIADRQDHITQAHAHVASPRTRTPAALR